jgi:hypothetical protein
MIPLETRALLAPHQVFFTSVRLRKTRVMSETFFANDNRTHDSVFRTASPPAAAAAAAATSISTDLLWLLVVCVMLASTLSSLFPSAPCTSTVGVPRPVLTPTKSVSTVVHTSQSTIVSFNALNFDDFMLTEHDTFFGVASVRTSHLKTVEVTPVVLSNSVDAKKEADNEAHVDGIATTIDKGKAVTKRATTSLQETTQRVVVRRKVNKKHASHKAHTGRFRKLADQLRQKESDLEWREANLTSELSKCENTQSRLQKLAIQLQQKAEQLSHDRSLTTRRMEECEALESKLQQWQPQLEVPKSVRQE